MKTAIIYARYSTDKQSENSIEDQLRVCERLAEQHDFKVVARFTDAAISGGTTTRPGYQAMLDAARRNEFDAIIAEDTSRLWRLLAEQAPRLAELSDLGIAVITYDLDTRLESAAILSAVNGAMSEQYRKEIGRRTRRGLEGLARSHKPTGGRAFGYVSAADSPSDDREINPEQAEVVRRIFTMYADGRSPRSIAAELNQEGVPSPGASWNRTERRSKGWMMSAIAGDRTRGIGILNNELYIGRVIWNRFQWLRSAVDSNKRKCVLNPESEWIVHDEERLRIVPQQLWDAVKARQQAQTDTIGERVKRGLSKDAAKHTGRGPRYLFSGLLKCGECGANFTIASKTSYACASRVNGKGCTNDAWIRRDVIEAGLLAGIKQELLSADAIVEVRRRVAKLLNDQKPAKNLGKAIDKAETEIENLTDAIASGKLRSSPALAERLQSVEQELASLKAASSRSRSGSVEKIMPRLVDEYRELVDDLATSLTSVNVSRARAEMRKLVGDIQVETTPNEIRLLSREGLVETALLRAAGQNQVMPVAGAGFEPATFGL